MDPDVVFDGNEVTVTGSLVKVNADGTIHLGRDATPASIVLEAAPDGSITLSAAHDVRVSGNTVKMNGTDFNLDNLGRRSGMNSEQGRRALVHDFGDGLTLNYNYDYPGGVTVFGPLRIRHPGVEDLTDVGMQLDHVFRQFKGLQKMVEELEARVERISTKLESTR